MAAKPRAAKQKKPEGKPLVVSRTFPPGTILSPEGPPKVVRIPPRVKVACPHCGSEKVKRRGAKGKKRYYECQRCVDRESLALRVFPVISG